MNKIEQHYQNVLEIATLRMQAATTQDQVVRLMNEVQRARKILRRQTELASVISQ